MSCPGAGRYSTRGGTIDKGGAGDTVIGGSGILAGVMRGGIWSRLGAGAAVLALTSCGSASGDPGALPVPTFPATPTAAASVGPAGAADQGRLPDDCTRLLGGNDLGALFGLPLDSVAVRTTIGTPAPAVGRTVSAYTDADAATKQWRTNAAVEDGPHREVTLGNARGVLVERPTDAVLLVANGAETLTFVLPQPVRIRDLSAADTLVDLALRVLPAVAAGAAAPAAG